MKDRMEIQQLKRMGKRELVRLVQDCDDENRKLAEESEKKQSRIKELEQQIVTLQEYMAKAAEKQQKMQVRYQEPGSLADSMIQVNGVIEAAQNAARQYLERIREMEAVKKKETKEAVEAARNEAERIILKAKTGAAQIQEASSNVLQSLQTEIDRMLNGARGEYEQRITEETHLWGTEAAGETDMAPPSYIQPVQEEAKKVPHLNEILNPIQEKEKGAAEPPKPEVDMPVADGAPPQESGTAEKADDFADGLSEEIRSVINDLTYKTQHLGEQLKDTY